MGVKTKKNTMKILRILLSSSLLLFIIMVSSSSACLLFAAWEVMPKLIARHFEAHMRECTGERNAGIKECKDCCKQCVENALEASIEASTTHCWRKCRKCRK